MAEGEGLVLSSSVVEPVYVLALWGGRSGSQWRCCRAAGWRSLSTEAPGWSPRGRAVFSRQLNTAPLAWVGHRRLQQKHSGI